MSYDYNGSWDSYTGLNAPLSWGTRRLKVQASVSDRIRSGAQKSKLIIAIDAYGLTFTLSSSGSYKPRGPPRVLDALEYTHSSKEHLLTTR
uniref:GH18 domain-containing protein n=1 Tax=Anopheles quadriannulatus TaxID=34691 RepID=A0A182X1C7_ANOQN